MGVEGLKQIILEKTSITANKTSDIGVKAQ